MPTHPIPSNRAKPTTWTPVPSLLIFLLPIRSPSDVLLCRIIESHCPLLSSPLLPFCPPPLVDGFVYIYMCSMPCVRGYVHACAYVRPANNPPPSPHPPKQALTRQQQEPLSYIRPRSMTSRARTSISPESAVRLRSMTQRWPPSFSSSSRM